MTACNRKGGAGVCRDAEAKEGDRIKGRPKSLKYLLTCGKRSWEEWDRNTYDWMTASSEKHGKPGKTQQTMFIFEKNIHNFFTYSHQNSWYFVVELVFYNMN